MINQKPWFNPPDYYSTRIKHQHVHSYQQKYLVLLQFHKKSNVLDSHRYV